MKVSKPKPVSVYVNVTTRNKGEGKSITLYDTTPTEVIAMVLAAAARKKEK